MSSVEIYKALIEAGASKEQAGKAADNVVSAQDAATKADIVRLEMKVVESKLETIKWVITANVVLAGVIVTALKLL